MVRLKQSLILVLALLCTLSLFTNEKAEQWTPQYMVENYKRVGSTEISPDGKWIAYTISEPLTEGEKSEYLTHIHVTDADGTEQFQLTRGEQSASNQQWSPDGSYIAFTSSRGGNGTQIWKIRLRGGEAEQLTDVEGGISAFAWSPDGKQIAFTMTDPETNEEKERRSERWDVNVVDTDFKYAHLYTIPVEKNENTERPVQRITEGEFHIVSFDWSPDGSTIAFDHRPTPKINDWVRASISIVPSDSGNVELLVDQGGMDSDPIFSPDGSTIAFVSDGGTDRWARAFDIYTIQINGEGISKLPETFDRQPNLLGWSEDGNTLFYSEIKRTSIRLFSMEIGGDSYNTLTTGEGMFTGISLSNDRSHLAAVYQNFNTAPDVIVSPVGGFSPQQLTSIHDGYEKYPMGKAGVIQWESTDGFEIESPIIYPVIYDPDKQYPLILMVHGGPAGVYLESYTASSGVYPLQAFAAEGYVVLRPNFRGSSGYGKDFRFANVADWGFGDYEDLMTGVDHLIEEGVVHPDSLSILGWSYGGYMTSFALTRTDRFRAGIVGAGVTNLVSMTGTSDIPGFLPDYFEAELWEDYERYTRHSAMFQVENIETPTLILHPEEDVRVPPSQGWELYIALKRRGITTELVLYPRQPHGIQEPKFIIDAGQRQIEWLNKYIREKEVEPEIAG